MEKTVLCLVCPTPKKSPLCFESKEGYSDTLLILHQESLREGGEVSGAKSSLPVCGGMKW